MRAEGVYRVAALVADLRGVFAEAFGLVWVEGEVAGLHRSRAGHVYFDLEDDGAVLRAVVFRSAAQQAGDLLCEGACVRVRAQPDVYPQRGQLQLVVDRVVPAGEGAQRAALERLRRRLEAEGLFDAAHKRPLPFAPERVGIVTSLDGAALHDVVRALRRRRASLELIVAGARVQGEDAWREVVRGIHRLAALADVEVIVLARGGGSWQDLWAFNAEPLARAIFALEIPVISAIGHETDTVLCDLVADVRASTPTGVADLIAPDGAALAHRVGALSSRLGRSQRDRLRTLAARLRALERGLVHPRERLERLAERLAGARGRLLRACDRVVHDRSRRLGRSARRLEGWNARPLLEANGRLEQRRRALVLAGTRAPQAARARLEGLSRRLDALSPLGVLRRGYAIARRAADGAILVASREVEVGETVDVRLAQGTLRTRVTERDP